MGKAATKDEAVIEDTGDLNEKSGPAGMPDPPSVDEPVPGIPMAIMSEKQKSIFQLIKTTSEPIRFDSVEDLAPRILMQVPNVFAKEYPERSYRWASVADLDQEIEGSRGMWQCVTRSNHSRIPERYFDLATGGILYQGQNILVFTWRDNVNMLNKRNIDEFEASVKTTERESHRKFHDASGAEIGEIEQVRDMGDGRSPMRLNDDSDYDFGSPMPKTGGAR